MARKRNQEYIEAARKASQSIMIEEGYNAASYTSIAERCGLARTTVQHYFPSKESFATEIMNRIAAVATERAMQMAPEVESPFVTYYLTSQIAYGIFYATEGSRRFLADICASRDLQHSVAPDYIGDAFGLFSIEEPTSEDRLDLEYAIGGIYEMHYLFLRDGKTPDFAWLLRNVMTIVARMIGLEDSERDRMLKRYTLEQGTLIEMGREFCDQLKCESRRL